MTEKEYRSHPAISRSELWRMDDSPEKFKWFREHPPATTPAFLFGQVAHKLLLQPDTFDTEFIVMPPIDRRTKAGKEQYEAFLSEAGERAVVTADDYDKAAAMVEAALRNQTVATWIEHGFAEVPFFWTDPDTGVDCKCRIDLLTTDAENAPLIVDYKTAGSAKTDVFNQHLFKYGYHFQSAMYSEGVMTASNLIERPSFIFIVQEKTAPYSVNLISVSAEVTLAGLDKYRELLGTYKFCSDSGYWYGYNGPLDEVNESYLPGWMQLGVEDED